MMFVEQKKPSWWTLFFACAYLISGVGVFVLGLLAKDVWQILSGLFLFSLGQQIAASYLFKLSLFDNYRLFLVPGTTPGLSGAQAGPLKEHSAGQD
ncbi:hypothetical protein [Bifidobacterium pseudocatenulatum]|uniref:hypothetical protein n=1 Tax=Bifidobacterium pseudocatenulatum TaxID=28026 RepID=UPI0011C12E6C|nr:hypothetical protein [Bifidobacterium pseudocatenulatum]